MRRGLPLLLAAAACAPPVVDEPWLIDAARVLAVTVEPPEAPPGARISLRAFVAAPGGQLDSAELHWAPCEQPRPFSQNESVNPACIGRLADAPGAGLTTVVALAIDVCARFGPDAPSEGVRPRDADATGGFYQPVGVRLDDAASFAFVRLWCRPAGISLDLAQAWARAARPNTTPTFTLLAAIAGHPARFEALPAGAAIDLFADWSSSPEELYVLVAPGSGTLQTATERYDVSWFVTTGTITSARSSSGTGRWQLPAEPGEGTLWAVLRDDRGGVAVRATSARWR